MRFFVFCICLTLTGCTGFFFQPMTKMVRTPADVGIEYEDVIFKSVDGLNLHGWFLPAQKKALGTVVFYHGNAENISTHLGSVYWLPEQGFNVFLFDYRGYGRSQGYPHVDGVHADAVTALKYVQSRPDVDKDKMIVFGQSVGGAIAIYTVGSRHWTGIKAVVVEGAFSEYRKIARHVMADSILMWPFQWPLSLTISNEYSPVKVIHNISPVPLLLVQGTSDKVIPVEHSTYLFDAAGEPKQRWLVEGAPHIAVFYINNGEYRDKLVEFMTSVLATH